MFHSKKEKVDFKRVTQKFLDSKRESRQRAHALRTLLGEIFCSVLHINSQKPTIIRHAAIAPSRLL